MGGQLLFRLMLEQLLNTANLQLRKTPSNSHEAWFVRQLNGIYVDADNAWRLLSHGPRARHTAKDVVEISFGVTIKTLRVKEIFDPLAPSSEAKKWCLGEEHRPNTLSESLMEWGCYSE